ncbi:MAG: flagellar M-ring protein FliF [Treponema sp.]|nr:flagellar M-ring protein FliF [Treponema sp.]
MSEFAKKLLGSVKILWGKLTMMQRVILCGITVAVIVGVIALFSVSSSSALVSVIDAPIRDEDARDRIITRINEEGVRTYVTPSGLIQVADETTARRMRAILIREDLIPRGIDPWAIFDRERWTITDFERNVNRQRAQTQMVTEHIKAVDGVDNASVNIIWPERTLFASDQNPVTASVIITPRPGSDIAQNRHVIQGIERLLQLAVEGLRTENIVITDYTGVILNDFAGMAAMDRLALIEREHRQRQALEAKIRADVLRQLQAIFSDDRVRDLNVSIEMDMSARSVETTEYLPTVIRPRTPGLPYDDSEIVVSVPRSTSSSSTLWEGTGFNPEGPPGVEGQTPPAFRDMSNLFGRMNQETLVQNEEIGSRTTQEETSPQINRISVAVNIDGTWRVLRDETGNPVVTPQGSIEREYTPLPDDQRLAAVSLVQNAIGFNLARGDSVTVQNIPFDRNREFADEDAAYFRERQRRTTLLLFLSGIALLLLGFIIFRIVAKEMERRKRLAEEERARREQALRESQMAEAEQDGLDVSISIEDRGRMELMESVTNLAKERPEDCAQLIRTWLLEE